MICGIPILNDWVEIGTILALALVIYQIWSAKRWRRKDLNDAEKRHSEDLDAIQQQANELHVIAKQSTDTVSILSKLLTTMTDHQLSESDRRKKEDELRDQQRLIEIRPFFTFKMGGTRGGGWNLILINQGSRGAKGFSVKKISNNIKIQSTEFPYAFGSEEAASIRGTVTTAMNPKAQGETP